MLSLTAHSHRFDVFIQTVLTILGFALGLIALGLIVGTPMTLANAEECSTPLTGWHFPFNESKHDSKNQDAYWNLHIDRKVEYLIVDRDSHVGFALCL